jgi:5-methylcytosine-specific restriction endonuclease McrA
MQRERRYKYNKEEVKEAVDKSECYADVFRNLGLPVNGGSYPWIKKLIKSHDISVDHFSPEKAMEIRLKKLREATARDWAAPIPNGSREKAKNLKLHMLAHGKKYECSDCGLTEWRGNKISLDIDHTDGNCENNETNNLQFLCPNCHRQKTHLDILAKKNKCETCGNIIGKKSKWCRPCSPRSSPQTTKIDWPDKENLEKLVWSKPMTRLSKELGVSDNSIIKRCKKLGIERPDRYYWLKKQK